MNLFQFKKNNMSNNTEISKDLFENSENLKDHTENAKDHSESSKNNSRNIKNSYENRIIIFSYVHETLYRTALNMFIDRPIIGHGPKMFRVKCSDSKYSEIIGFSEGE